MYCVGQVVKTPTIILNNPVTVSFGYILYCVCFNLHCGCCNLFCNVYACVCVGVLVICVLVFTVFCIVCTVFFVLFHLCFVCSSVRTTATEWQLNCSYNNNNNNNNNNKKNTVFTCSVNTIQLMDFYTVVTGLSAPTLHLASGCLCVSVLKVLTGKMKWSVHLEIAVSYWV